jgi:hypothetical protein
MSHLVDMARTPKEKQDLFAPQDISSLMTDYPSGLTICLGDAELAKLDLPPDAEPGDMICLDVLAKVVSIHKSEGGCSATLQITAMGIEEEAENDRVVPASRAKRYAKAAE